MTTFLDALKRKATVIDQARQSAPIAPQPTAGAVPSHPITEDLPPLEATITIDEGKRRIDIAYNRKPTLAILDALKTAGYRWHHVDRVWYHRDCYANRVVAAQITGADIELGAPEPIAPVLEVRDTPSEIPAPDIDRLYSIEAPINSPYDLYRRQCREIVEYTGQSGADLQLLAWSVLHAKIFGAVKETIFTAEEIERWKKTLN